MGSVLKRAKNGKVNTPCKRFIVLKKFLIHTHGYAIGRQLTRLQKIALTHTRVVMVDACSSPNSLSVMVFQPLLMHPTFINGGVCITARSSYWKLW
jgi:hypothetical protein